MTITNPTILAIDDHLDNLITLQAVLSDALPGCELLTATSGAKGITIAQTDDPDVILLDVVMPDMDGFEVCSTLKSDPRTKDIPVIFLTALGTVRDTRVRALELGAEALLGKPWNDQELLAQIRAMVKIKAGSQAQRLEKQHLEKLVAERTSALEKELTERKRVEEELRQSNTNWTNTFNAITDNITVISPNHEILEINSAGCLALKRSREEILGKKCYELMHCRSSPVEGCPCDQSIAERAPCMGEFEHYGRHFNLVTWPTMNENGQVVSVTHIVKDVTQDKVAEAERARLEEQVRVSQKMEAIGSLAGGIAHDFNNMLYVITSFTDLALESTCEGDEMQKQLLEVKNAANRSAALVRQLLAFGRKQILQPVPLDLNRVTTEMEKMLHRILGEDIILAPSLTPDLWLTMADPSQIEQVLMNLVVNARDAMPTGGRLTITTANLEIPPSATAIAEAVKPGAYVMLSVTDTGCGMDAQTCERIFEPFFSTKERGKGTGLGLSTVYGIVRQSGGEIVVESKPGRGTTFKIYLPRGESTLEAAQAASCAPTRTTGNETVLVVEDEASVRDLARQVLTRAGYTVLSAPNGSEALQLSERHHEKIHLVLTDVVMPEMSGRALAEQIARMRPGTKILYMSGYTDEAIIHHGTVLPGTNFIAKPFGLTDLRRKVREVLDSP